MIDKDTFVPTNEDMHKLIRAFVSVHVDNILDGVGPNKPDAPFFTRVASANTIDEEDYIEMSERFYKYVNTQLPLIQHIAGYPPTTDWNAALTRLHDIGMKAKQARLKREAEQKALEDANREEVESFKSLFNLKELTWDAENEKVNYSEEMLKDIEEAVDKNPELLASVLSNHADYIQRLFTREVYHRTLLCERYESYFFSKGGKKITQSSIKVSFEDKYDVGIPFYKYMKNNIGDWRDFNWDKNEKCMKVKDERNAIKRVIECIDKLNEDVWLLYHNFGRGVVVPFDYSQLQLMLLNAPDDEAATDDDYTVELIKGNVMVNIPYTATDMRHVIKTIGRGKFNPDTKNWGVSLSLINDVIKELKQSSVVGSDELVQNMMSIDEIADYVNAKAERIHLSGSVTIDDEEVIDSMKERLAKIFPTGHVLYPFQYTGVRYAEISNGRCLIGDDMGVGKTIQALAYAALHPEHHPVLVVAPANVKFNWLKESKKWLGSTYTSEVIRKGKDPVPDTDIVIINYDIMNKQKDALLARGFKTIICDESHYLKNYKAARTKATVEIAKGCESVLFLSGTAMSNRPIELWTTLMTLRPNEWGGRWKEYTQRYCDGYHDGWGWKVDGSSNEEELNAKLRDMMIRRLKKEVMSELPDKVRQYHYVEPTPSQWKMYNNAQRESMTSLADHQSSNKGAKVLVELTRLRHMCGLMKVDATVDYINTYLSENDKPLLVFTHHKDVLEGILKSLQTQDNTPSIALITGDIASEQRQKVVDGFQSGKIDVVLATTPAAKEGLTLTAADTVVFVEREWSPSHEEQAEDRVNRIGQDAETVWAVYMTVTNSIDEKFNKVIESKREVIKGILDGGEIGKRDAVVTELLKEMMKEGNEDATRYFKERFE